MVSNDEISRMLGAKRRGEDPKKELDKIRGKKSPNGSNSSICSNCSTQNPINASFCMECGGKLAPVEKIEFNQVTKPSAITSAKNESTEHNQATYFNNHSNSKNNSDFFAPEKKGIEMGVIGGILMMGIAVIWFIGGLVVNIVFFYPAILFIIGLYAFLKGLATGNVSGEKKN